MSKNFELVIPRVGGHGFGTVQLSVTDSLNIDGARWSDGLYVDYQRSIEERRFWWPHLAVTTVEMGSGREEGREGTVSMTVANSGHFAHDGKAVLLVKADGDEAARITVPDLGPGLRFTAEVPEMLTAGASKLSAEPLRISGPDRYDGNDFLAIELDSPRFPT